jgi:macrophage erythroblast attacher
VEESQENPQVLQEYFEKRLNLLLIDFMLRNDYLETAKAFVKCQNLQEFSDYDLFSESLRIQEALRKKDLRIALDWCKTHKSKLQKHASCLEFKLRLQQFIELVKEQNFEEAIQYSRKHCQLFKAYREESS